MTALNPPTAITVPVDGSRGTTTVADTVIQKIAGMAAREVPGVHALGNVARRAIDNLTHRVPGSRTSVVGGIGVEQGEAQTAISASIVVNYGASIVEVSQALRQHIIRSVELDTGLQVVAVDISVIDVRLPEDDFPDAAAGDRP